MEEHRKSITNEDKEIIELTQAMEIDAQEGGDIIDLTRSIDGPVEPSPPAPAPPAETFRKEDTASPSIEEEIDVAFHSMQAEPSRDTTEEISDARLFDTLSDITADVDLADPGATSPDTLESGSMDIGEQDRLAEEEVSFALDVEQTDESSREEILELTEIVNPEEVESSVDATEDEKVIELTEIVTPAELAQAGTADLDNDDEIIELTDIVTPEEMRAAEEEGMEDVLELVDIVDPRDVPAATHESTVEETTVGNEADLAVDRFMDEMIADTMEPVEPMDFAIGEAPGIPLEEITDPDEEQEQVIQLSDVLGHSRREKRLPIEKIKMGAEEDIEADPISLEREITANALGLDLEKQMSEMEDWINDPHKEKAVEHLLRSKFGPVIDRLVAEGVEKAMAGKSTDPGQGPRGEGRGEG